MSGVRMRQELVDWALEQRGIGISGKCVLLTLVHLADDDGVYRCGHRKLSEFADCSINTVFEALKILEARGLITRGKHRVRDGRYIEIFLRR